MTRWKWIVIGIAIIVAAPFLTKFVLDLTQPKTRGITLRYLSGAEAADLLRDRSAPSTAIWTQIEGVGDNVVYLRGSDRDLADAAKILMTEDRPKPQVALKFQIIEADGFKGRDSAISGVESALRGLFRFQGYRLVSEAFVRAKAESSSSQILVGSDSVRYGLSVDIGDVLRRSDKASVEIDVRLFDATYREANLQTTLLSTRVQLPDGQTAVLGTARAKAERGALILVVTPEMR